MVENSAETADPIVIKKYANRRLYDTTNASFVTLDDLHQMVKDGIGFVVRGAKSGRDITSSVLAQIIAEQVDEEGAVDLEIRAGECHRHHARTIHGSKANRSSRRRCGYTMRYMPASVKYHPENHGGHGHGIYLARGRDLAGNDYLDPAKPAPESLQRRWA